MRPTINFNSQDYASAYFETERVRNGLWEVREEHWYMERPEIPQALYRYGSPGYEVLIFAHARCLIRLSYSQGGMSGVAVAARERTDALAVLAEVKTAFPPIERTKEHVPVVFWSRGVDGIPRAIRREIKAPGWEAISHNYPSGVRSRLQTLMHDYQASPEGGKLILWTGEPGTGKTFALRALAQEWGPWCDAHFVMDPEAFFGGPVDYLFQVALNDDDGGKRWRLIVCEDTGELLSADAGARTGPALGRFLNICDGILGQGLQVQILITTNEDIKTFHPAVTRPGRAASQIRFDKFHGLEAAEWLGRPVTGNQSLAELFALQRGEDTRGQLERARPGFAT